jgi:hypothetical protein
MMTDRALDFANNWVAENVNATGYGPEDGPNPDAQEALPRFLDDAREEDLSREELEAVLGDLDDFMEAAFEQANDSEVERLANRDD